MVPQEISGVVFAKKEVELSRVAMTLLKKAHQSDLKMEKLVKEIEGIVL